MLTVLTTRFARMKAMLSLNDERKKINEIDKEMAKLFEMRMSAVKNIAEYKKSAGLPIFDKEREFKFGEGPYGLANVAPTVATLFGIDAPECWEKSIIE